MDDIEEFVDERQKSWCIHCNGYIADLKANHDHVPSRCLLRKPLPRKLPQVLICKACNQGFAPDEEYLAAFLGSVLSGSADPDRQLYPKVKGILSWNENLRARIERSKTEYKTHGGESQIVWKPDSKSINRVVVKNARGHVYFEHGEPILDEPKRVWSAPLSVLSVEDRTQFENIDLGPGWPEVGSRMITRLLTGQDLWDGWIIVQEGIYRYAVVHDGGMLVRSVLSEYLATEVHWENW